MATHSGFISNTVQYIGYYIIERLVDSWMVIGYQIAITTKTAI